MRIESTSIEHVDGFWRAVDSVARERKYLIFTEGPEIAKTRQFVADIIEKKWTQFLALNDEEEVVGWCDVVRFDNDGFAHCGRLGMGVITGYRGMGIGHRLLEVTIDAAFAKGIERIELEVYGSNHAAFALYKKFGFEVEGRKVKARFIDGAYDDSILMVLFRPA